MTSKVRGGGPTVHDIPAAGGQGTQPAHDSAASTSENRYRAIAELTSDYAYAFRVEADGRVVVEWIGGAFTQITGYTPQEVEARGGGITLVHPDDRTLALQRLQTLLSGQPDVREFRIITKTGDTRWVRENARPGRDEARGCMRIYGAAQDITERKRAEESRRRSREELELRVEQRTTELTALNQALQMEIHERKRMEAEREALLAKAQAERERAELANRAKDEFLAVVSHELRTPLTPLLTWTRLLRSGKLGEAEVTRALEVIERSVKAQAKLVEDLLDASRIVAGKFRLNLRHISLQPVVEGALETIRPAAEAKGIRLRSVCDDCPTVVSGDPSRLQQVVSNLLSNAVKFTPPGGWVQVRLQRVHSRVEIIVSDTGQGISPAFMPYIFDRFRQADSTSTRAHGGLGLGLAIARHLVELHGGQLRVESPGEGQGATFTVALPLAPLSQPHIDPVDAAPSPTSVQRNVLRGVRALIVDDEHDTLDTLRAVLASCGAEVRVCGSAAEALASLQQWRPDLLISDIGMPYEDGYKLIRQVRALDREAGGEIPAVALTGYARAEDRAQVLSAGYQMHISKPVDPAELVTAVANISATMGKRAEEPVGLGTRSLSDLEQ